MIALGLLTPGLAAIAFGWHEERAALIVSGFWVVLLGLWTWFAIRREGDPHDLQDQTRVGFDEGRPASRSEVLTACLVGAVLGIALMVVIGAWLLAEPMPAPVTWETSR